METTKTEGQAAPAVIQETTSKPAPRVRRNNPRVRSGSLAKYQRVVKEREVTPDDEIRVTWIGQVHRYVAYAQRLFDEKQKESVTFRATGRAVSIAISACEALKRVQGGLHQVTSIGWTSIVDEYEPLEEGMEKRTENRSVPSLSILLTKNEALVDKSAPGYQAPEEYSSEEQSRDFNVRPRREPRMYRRRSPTQGNSEDKDSKEEGVNNTDTQRGASGVDRKDKEFASRKPRRKEGRRLRKWNPEETSQREPVTGKLNPEVPTEQPSSNQ